MEEITLRRHCKACSAVGSGNFCNICGQTYDIHKITVRGIVHEVFHFFTHIDKGFPFTIRQLAIAPGNMQRDYLMGKRSKYQKPFSTFFLCASLAAFAMYLIHKPEAGSGSHEDLVKEDFMRHYYVMLQAALIPVYALFTWGLFGNNRINYAESLVFFIYTLSFTLLISIFTNLVALVAPGIPTLFYEIPVLFGYVAWTNLNIFFQEYKWRVILKTIVNVVACYFLFRFAAEKLMQWI